MALSHEETQVISQELNEEQGEHDSLKESMRQAKLDLDRAQREMTTAQEDYEALTTTKERIQEEKERNEVT